MTSTKNMPPTARTIASHGGTQLSAPSMLTSDMASKAAWDAMFSSAIK